MVTFVEDNAFCVFYYYLYNHTHFITFHSFVTFFNVFLATFCIVENLSCIFIHTSLGTNSLDCADVPLISIQTNKPFVFS